MVLAVTAIIGLAESVVPSQSLVVLYMPALLWMAVLWGVRYAIGASIASGLAFDWYFLPPTHRLFVHASDIGALAVLVACALLMGELSSRAHVRARASERARGLIAEEQAALRRVATLVAREVPTCEVFGAVCAEVGALVEAATAYLLRFEQDGTATVVSSWQAEESPALGIRSTLTVPVTVGGRPWGAIGTGSTHSEGFDSETEERLADFTELVAIAISNSEARAEVEASRVRIVAAADAERRRIERDLHDGAQQRLIALALELRGTELSLLPEQPEVRARLDYAASELGAVLDELKEISRGIHPALLSDRGLRAAIRSLGRRSPIPVEIEAAQDERLPEVVEVAAYYVVSEALVNAGKHSGASVVHVTLHSDGERLKLRVSDDGVGGADPSGGSGLVGLADRAGALGGHFSLRSPVGSGTTLTVELPLRVGADDGPPPRAETTASLPDVGARSPVEVSADGARR
jgi:signal transduction histidine kinase